MKNLVAYMLIMAETTGEMISAIRVCPVKNCDACAIKKDSIGKMKREVKSIIAFLNNGDPKYMDIENLTEIHSALAHMSFSSALMAANLAEVEMLTEEEHNQRQAGINEVKDLSNFNPNGAKH